MVMNSDRAIINYINRFAAKKLTSLLFFFTKTMEYKLIEPNYL